MIRMAKIPGYLTIAEAAAKIGVSHSTTARYIRKGELAAIDLGGQKLVAESAAKGFVKPLRGNPNLLHGRKRRTR